MTTPAQRKKGNIKRSFNKAIKDRIQTPNTAPLGLSLASGWVDYDEYEYDNDGFDQWIRVETISGGGGNWFGQLFQITVYSRWSSDNFGYTLDSIIDAIEDGIRDDHGLIPMYDYSVTPSSPTLIDGVNLLVVNTYGKIGEPQEPAVPAVGPEGVNAQVITFRVLVAPDDFTGARGRYT